MYNRGTLPSKRTKATNPKPNCFHFPQTHRQFRPSIQTNQTPNAKVNTTKPATALASPSLRFSHSPPRTPSLTKAIGSSNCLTCRSIAILVSATLPYLSVSISISPSISGSVSYLASTSSLTTFPFLAVSNSPALACIIPSAFISQRFHVS